MLVYGDEGGVPGGNGFAARPERSPWESKS